MGLIADINVKQDVYQSKKESYANVYHEPFETFNPAYQLDYLYAPAVNISSPGGTGSTITTKKEATLSPEVGGIAQGQSDVKTSEESANSWLLPVIIVGGVVIGLIYMLKKKKKK